jgi:DNA-binding transcriptional MerR regulator
MTTLDDVKKLQNQGATEEQIVQLFREKGVSYREIADAVAQSKIKAAVEQPEGDGNARAENTMTQSMQANDQTTQPTQPEYATQPGTEYAYDYAPQGVGNVSADLISEIAEQIVAEKLTEIRTHLEKTLDLRTTMEARLEYLDERLKKIERSLDVLQTSVLRRVGDYITNVEDIKTELVETQKTFAKLAGHHRSSPGQHPTQHHPQHNQHHK